MNLAKQPLVTVLMPAFNADQYIGTAIESIRSQTFANWELIVIDDGSSDATHQVSKSFSSRDARISVYQRDHGGIVEALNMGLAAAAGAHIARLDADDIATPRRLALQLYILQKYPSAGIVGSFLRLMNDDGRLYRRIALPITPRRIAAALPRRNVIAHSAVMYRKSAIEMVGNYSDMCRHVEDYELWLRLMRGGWGFINLPLCLVKYRIHPGSVSHQNLQSQQAAALHVRLLHQRLTEFPETVSTPSLSEWEESPQYQAGMFAIQNQSISRALSAAAADLRHEYSCLASAVKSSREMAWLQARGLGGSIRRRSIGDFLFWLSQGLRWHPLVFLYHVLQRT